ncbi:MAG: T9SS type A sorting domain-containing protein [Ignavibacteriales bacterium]|nr:T9SS type A sorting domain-containing protein [Ignavibacteriales bacterium]
MSENNLPTDFRLEQNYPNPFNPTTTIKYTIPTNSFIPSGVEGYDVRMTIYDILGREIKNLVNEVKSPGNYEVTFDAVNLPSGVYYYRLKSNDFVQTKKMLLLK